MRRMILIGILFLICTNGIAQKKIKKSEVRKRIEVLRGINDYLMNDLGSLVEKGKYMDCDLLFISSKGLRLDLNKGVPKKFYEIFMTETQQFVIWESSKENYMTAIRILFRTSKNKIYGEKEGQYFIGNMKIEKPNRFHGWLFHFDFKDSDYIVEMNINGFSIYIPSSQSFNNYLTLEERKEVVEFIIYYLREEKGGD